MMKLTSLLFAVPAAYALIKQHMFYAILLLFLTGTSMVWHTRDKLHPDSMLPFWIDQVAIWSVIILTAYYATRLGRDKLFVLAGLFGVAAVLSYYLLVICDRDKEYMIPHSFLHVIASFCCFYVI